MRAVLALDAFARHAGADHLRQAVIVDGVQVEGVLDLLAHGVGPGLGAAHRDLERRLPRVDALGVELIQDGEQVARRDEDDVRLEIADQLDLPLGHAAGDRHHRQSEPLGAVMEAEPAGEQPVAVGILRQHAGPAAGRAHRARDDVGPGLDVVAAIADHRRLAGRAGGGVDAQQLVARHRHQPERIIVAQLGFGGEGKLAQIVERLEIVGMHAGLVEACACNARRSCRRAPASISAA